MMCLTCGYDDLWIEWEKGQRVFYDQRDDVVDAEGLFAGYGKALTECPECGANLE